MWGRAENRRGPSDGGLRVSGRRRVSARFPPRAPRWGGRGDQRARARWRVERIRGVAWISDCRNRERRCGNSGSDRRNRERRWGNSGSGCPTKRARCAFEGSGCPSSASGCAFEGSACPRMWTCCGSSGSGFPSAGRRCGNSWSGCPFARSRCAHEGSVCPFSGRCGAHDGRRCPFGCSRPGRCGERHGRGGSARRRWLRVRTPTGDQRMKARRPALSLHSSNAVSQSTQRKTTRMGTGVPPQSA